MNTTPLEALTELREKKKKAEEMICPACGYYCLGNGVFDCIDKKGYVSLIDEAITKIKEGV